MSSEDAARVMRAGSLPPTRSADVTVVADRRACPGGVAVGLRVREDELRPTGVPGRFALDRWTVGAHLRAVHGRLFQDVYAWAGETRTVDMTRRGGPAFVGWARVEEEFAAVAGFVADRGGFVGAEREEFVTAAAGVYHRVNAIHAFREGNGRSQREWLSDLARGAGYRVDWTLVHGAVNDRACRLAREGDLRPLRVMLERITQPLGPGDAEWDRLQRFVGRLAADRAPRSGTVPGDPMPGPAPRPGAAYGVGEHGRGEGYDR